MRRLGPCRAGCRSGCRWRLGGRAAACIPGTFASASLAIRMVQQYRVVRASGARGPFKVQTMAYSYAIEDASDDSEREILAYHWHPDGPGDAIRTPHLHVAGAHERLHLPTGRVSVEQVSDWRSKWIATRFETTGKRFSPRLMRNTLSTAPGTSSSASHRRPFHAQTREKPMPHPRRARGSQPT